MALLVLSFVAGVLTIVSPCILPILPFVLARADQPFRRGGLPFLLGLAVTFAGVALLASVAGGWAVELNRHGRTAALAVMTLFGLSLLFPPLAERVMAPLVRLGARLSERAQARVDAGQATAGVSLLLGVATGLLWAPCAGPVMGLILTGAALRGPNVETATLLLAYALGAAVSLAAGMLLGRRALSRLRQSLPLTEGLRRVAGAAVVAGAAAIWLGADTGVLTRLSTTGTAAIEQGLIAALQGSAGVAPARAAGDAAPAVSGPVQSLLVGAQPWLNGQLRSEDLRGKVVLVSFWTYSCINCLRTLPYVRAWAEKYKDRGLVVVGVHTPEFAFEKDLGNVRKAVSALGVKYPVVLDNDFAIWRAFDNNAWPALYFVGADGRIRHETFGEGDTDRSEHVIQQLLAEADHAPVSKDVVAVGRMASLRPPLVDAQGAQAAPDLSNLRSGESYVGYGHASNFASPDRLTRDKPATYRAAIDLPLNAWSLAGNWTVGPEFGLLNEKGGSIRYRFHARDLHLVLGASQDQPVRFRLTIDGKPPGADHGTDVDADGFGTVRDDRLYQLVRQGSDVTERTFEIEFLDAGVRAYAFTFG